MLSASNSPHPAKRLHATTQTPPSSAPHPAFQQEFATESSSVDHVMTPREITHFATLADVLTVLPDRHSASATPSETDNNSVYTRDLNAALRKWADTHPEELDTSGNEAAQVANIATTLAPQE